MAIAVDFDKLRAWINEDQDYKTGVILYTTYGDIQQLKQIFQSNPNPTEIIRRKLLSEIQRLYSCAKKDSPTVTKRIEIVTKTRTVTDPTHNDTVRLPDSEPSDQLYLQEKERVLLLFKEQSSLHSQLDTIESEQERTPICLKILELDKQVSAGWEALDYYKANGTFKKAPDKKEMTVIEMVKRRNTLRSYVSREKNPEKLFAYKLELFTIEEALSK